VIIAAAATPAADQLNTVLPGIAKSGGGNIVEMNVDKQGDVAIHRVLLGEGFVDLFDQLFGDKKDLFVGVGPGRVWLASGENSKEKLKQTIASLGEPKMTPTVFHMEMKMLPWVERWEEMAKKEKPGKTPEELENQRDWARRRARALAAFSSGSDALVIDMKVIKGEFTGDVVMETGLLRFAGKLMSAFSKTNFE
jgi:hypothetical protein